MPPLGNVVGHKYDLVTSLLTAGAPCASQGAPAETLVQREGRGDVVGRNIQKRNTKEGMYRLPALPLPGSFPRTSESKRELTCPAALGLMCAAPALVCTFGQQDSGPVRLKATNPLGVDFLITSQAWLLASPSLSSSYPTPATPLQEPLPSRGPPASTGPLVAYFISLDLIIGPPPPPPRVKTLAGALGVKPHSPTRATRAPDHPLCSLSILASHVPAITQSLTTASGRTDVPPFPKRSTRNATSGVLAHCSLCPERFSSQISAALSHLPGGALLPSPDSTHPVPLQLFPRLSFSYSSSPPAVILSHVSLSESIFCLLYEAASS